MGADSGTPSAVMLQMGAAYAITTTSKPSSQGPPPLPMPPSDRHGISTAKTATDDDPTNGQLMDMLRMMNTGQQQAREDQTRHNELRHDAVMRTSARPDACKNRIERQEERTAARIHDLERAIDARSSDRRTSRRSHPRHKTTGRRAPFQTRRSQDHAETDDGGDRTRTERLKPTTRMGKDTPHEQAFRVGKKFLSSLPSGPRLEVDLVHPGEVLK